MEGRRVTSERRRAVRRIPGESDPLSRARLRTGPELAVTEISDVGASVRTTARLLPGTHVDVHLMTLGGRVLRRARVARAAVRAIDTTGIAFQVALAFDSPVDSSARRVALTRDEEFASPGVGNRLPGSVGARFEAPDASAPIEPAGADCLAPDLDKEAGCTSAKESLDVHH
jgi:hypothetical protein